MNDIEAIILYITADQRQPSTHLLNQAWGHVLKREAEIKDKYGLRMEKVTYSEAEAKHEDQLQALRAEAFDILTGLIDKIHFGANEGPVRFVTDTVTRDELYQFEKRLCEWRTEHKRLYPPEDAS